MNGLFEQLQAARKQQQRRGSVVDNRDAIQSKVFTRWVNSVLRDRGLAVSRFPHDLTDGVLLGHLTEILTDTPLPFNIKQAGILPRYSAENGGFSAEQIEELYPPLTKVERLDNWTGMLQYLSTELEFELVNITAAALASGQRKIFLGLVWRFVLKFVVVRNHSNDEAAPTTLGESKVNLLHWVNSLVSADHQVKNFKQSFTQESMKALCSSLLGGDNNNNNNNNDSLDSLLTKLHDAKGLPQLLDAEDVGADEQSMVTFLAVLKSVSGTVTTSTTSTTTTTSAAVDRKQQTTPVVTITVATVEEPIAVAVAVVAAPIVPETVAVPEEKDREVRSALQQRRKEKWEQEHTALDVCLALPGKATENNSHSSSNSATVAVAASVEDHSAVQFMLAVERDASADDTVQWTNKVGRFAGGSVGSVWRVTDPGDVKVAVVAAETSSSSSSSSPQQQRVRQFLLQDCRGWYLCVTETGVIYCDPAATAQCLWRIEDTTLRSSYYDHHYLTSTLNAKNTLTTIVELTNVKSGLCTVDVCYPFSRGLLELKEKGFLGVSTWTRGLWSFNGDLLCYQKADSTGKPKGKRLLALLPLQILYVSQKQWDTRRFSLKVENPETSKVRFFHFRADTTPEAQYWIQAFRKRGVLQKIELVKNQQASLSVRHVRVRRASAPDLVRYSSKTLLHDVSMDIPYNDNKNNNNNNTATPTITTTAPAPAVASVEGTLAVSLADFDPSSGHFKGAIALRKGTEVRILSSENGWSFVTTQTVEGYVPTSYLDDTSPAAPKQPTQTLLSVSIDPSVHKRRGSALPELVRYQSKTHQYGPVKAVKLPAMPVPTTTTAMRGPVKVAAYAFEAIVQDFKQAISIDLGAHCTVLRQEGDWSFVALQTNNEEGYVPTNYLRDYDPAVDDIKQQQPAAPQQQQQQQQQVAPSGVDTGLALYDFTATEENQVSFKKGQLLIIKTPNVVEAWHLVSVEGKEGFVPANRVLIKPSKPTFLQR